jgi:1-acyl-sn-glycerol-3-phosphate acyltransferase
VRGIVHSTIRAEWSGEENLPESGFIAAANHMTNFDPLPFAVYLYENDCRPRILAKASLWKIPVLRWILERTGMIPVSRGSVDAGESLRVATAELEGGACVAIYPEGTLTRDPDLWPMNGKTGMARLALASRTPVVPIAHWGAQDVLGRYSKVLKPFPRKRVQVKAGPPVDLSEFYDRPVDTATLRVVTTRVLDAISDLLEEVRGEAAPAVRFDLRKHPEYADPAKSYPPLEEDAR